MQNTSSIRSPHKRVRRISYRNVTRIFILGIVICVFTLNGVINFFAQRISISFVSNALRDVGNFPNKLYKTLPVHPNFWFELFIHWIILSVGVLCILLIITSLLRQSATVFILGFMGLLSGIFVVTWISLVGYVSFKIISIILWIINGVKEFFSRGLAFFLESPLIYCTVVIGVLFAGFVIVGIIQIIKESNMRFSKSLFMKGIFIAASIFVVWLFSGSIIPVTVSIIEIIALIVASILSIAVTVGILLLLGSQFYDQFSSARVCGKDTYEIFNTGFGMGASIAILMLVCSANSDYGDIVNQSWSITVPFLRDVNIVNTFHTWVPQDVRVYLQSLLENSSMPIFDSICIVVISFLSSCSLVMGMVSGIDIKPIRGFFSLQNMPPLLKGVGGVFIAVGINIIDSIASKGESS
jgi:hypothetical protein